jgi:hypothetical protein
MAKAWVSWKLAAAVGLLLVSGCYWAYGVKVDATVDRTAGASYCPFEYPIAIQVRNNTLKRLAGVDLVVEGWRNGRSENVLTNRYYSFDKVLSPLSRGTQCFSDKAFYVKEDSSEPGGKSGFSFDRIAKEMKHFDAVTKNVELVIIKEEPSFR